MKGEILLNGENEEEKNISSGYITLKEKFFAEFNFAIFGLSHKIKFCKTKFFSHF